MDIKEQNDIIKETTALAAEKLAYVEPTQSTPTQGIRLENIFGMLIQVTTTPTWKPKTFRDSLAIDTSSGKIYYYDSVNNVWKSVSGSTYGGYIASAASSSTLPTGWSVSYNSGTKVYTITHNLGTTNYTVTVSTTDSNGTTYFVPIITRNSNTLVIEFDDVALVAGAASFNFIVTLIV